MKWFTNPQSIEELKQQYKKLALKHHPDIGGTNEAMQEINTEYDLLFSQLKNIHKSAAGETYTAKTETTETPEEFKHIIDCLIHLAGIKIEICGSWVWITGSTYQHREQLKKLNFKYSRSKSAWYFHSEGYRKHNSKSFSLDEIRDLYGSKTIRAEPKLKLAVV